MLNKKKVFEQYVAMREYDLSSFSFISLFLWQNYFTFEFLILNDALCVFLKNEMGTFMYLPPLSSALSDDIIDEGFDYMHKRNHGNNISRIENICEDQLENFSDNKFLVRKKCEEYCYSRQDIAILKGNKYKSKRHDRNLFLRNYTCKFIPFSMDMIAESNALYDKWAEVKIRDNSDNNIFVHMIKENKTVHNTALTFYQNLDLVGRVVVDDNKIIAYTFGYKINRNMFCILFEVTDPAYKGLSTYVFSEFCRDEALKSYEYINTMDDIFLDNIKKTKESFCPCRKISSYTVIKQNG